MSSRPGQRPRQGRQGWGGGILDPRPPPCLLGSIPASFLSPSRPRASSRSRSVSPAAGAWLSGPLPGAVGGPAPGRGCPRQWKASRPGPKLVLGGAPGGRGEGGPRGGEGSSPGSRPRGETPEAEWRWGRVTGGDQKGGRRTLEVGGKWGTQTSSGGLRAVGQEPGRVQGRRPGFSRWKTLCARRLGTAPPGCPALGYPRSRKTNRPGQAGLDVRGKPNTRTRTNTLTCVQPPARTPCPSHC